MSHHPLIAPLRALYTPGAAELAAALPNAGDSLLSACTDLARDPDVQRCEYLAANARGLEQLAMRLREALLRESEPSKAA